MQTDHSICFGCGATLQTTDKDKPGYVPASSLDREDILCQRCFRLKHYNETAEVDLTADDFLNMVSSIQQASGIVVHIIDVFDIQGSLLSSLPRIVGDKPIILVGNKVDLLPKSTNQRKLKQWIRSAANDLGIKPLDVFLISSIKGYGIDELANQLAIYRQDDDVYIVGVTNVGKSTFINQLIKRTSGLENVITTSYFPGTTLGMIKIPLDDTTFLIDTPGIVNDHQMVHYVSEHDLKLITPTKEIKARVYQLNEQQTLFFGGLARLDFVKGEKRSFVCYFSNQLPIHRTKLANADKLYERQLGNLLSPPNKGTMANLPAFTEQAFKLPKQSTDIVFPGLGWVTVKEGDVTVNVHSPQTVAVSIRQSLT